MPPKQTSLFPENYDAFLIGLKQRIRSAQIRAALAVNRELVMLYWQTGQDISLRVQQQKWGSKVIKQLAADLKREFPDMTGLSARNLQYMRTFAEAYQDEAIVQRLVAQLPWGHNVTLLDKLRSLEERMWYAQQALENGWSRDILVLQIETGLYQRLGSATTNFHQALPSPQSDLAQQLLKSPYNFEFLTLSRDAQERDLERALVDRIRDFLMELGVGFAFLGSQYPIVVDDKEYRLDLFFYHTRLHCYVVIDLKIGEFEPEFSGKMNFYVSAVDHFIRTEEDKPTIGIILCRSKRKTTVEFALQGVQKPIGVATYQLKQHLPETLKENLPTAEQLEMEVDAALLGIEAQEEVDEKF
ncbi:MAG: PDDEXK nuclease domain-containing protein [Phormidesmis sp. CAN_BIN44]|nr:PDDEXK nuclease domain-containing protein [Phormidesmis sp. CAN_BIN44]